MFLPIYNVLHLQLPRPRTRHDRKGLLLIPGLFPDAIVNGNNLQVTKSFMLQTLRQYLFISDQNTSMNSKLWITVSLPPLTRP